MAENLNYADSSKTPSLKGNSWCYNENNEKCKEYGRLYTWMAAIDSVALAMDKNHPQNCGNGTICEIHGDVQGVCPTGWHLPSKSEWELLIDRAIDSKSLKSQMGWLYGQEGNDDYGFSALPGGVLYRSIGFQEDGSMTSFWSSSEGDGNVVSKSLANRIYMHDYTLVLSGEQKIHGFSIRCIKDGSVSSMTE